MNGARDPFGVPEATDADRVVVLPGEAHSLAGSPAAVTRAVGTWLRELSGSVRADRRVIAKVRGRDSGAYY